MSSKKTKRAGKPDAEKRATHSPAEQDLDIAVQSRRPNQITYPFDSPHILEKQVIPWLCSVVYSGEYLAGGNKETESGRAWAESKIKSLTGGDPITARFMRQDFFTFVPKFKLLISGNHMPKLKNVDEAMRRRLYLLPFTQTFKGKDRDPHLAETLTHEYEGILQWIVEGAIAYENEGLKPPLIVQEATNTYFESEDFFNEWLAACCELGANAYENPTNLFNSFKSYTEKINEPTGSDREFRQRLEKAGFTRGSSTSKGGRFWRGLRLTPTSKH